MSEIAEIPNSLCSIPKVYKRSKAPRINLIIRWRTGQALLDRFCKDNSVGLVDIQSGPRSSRGRAIVALRRRFCMFAKANGIGRIYIGRLLNLDHSTVTYHLNAAYRANKRTKREKYDRGRRARGNGTPKD